MLLLPDLRGRCRVCKKVDDIICYPSDDPRGAVCPTCCGEATQPDGEEGHQWEYERGDGYMCKYCGILAECTQEGYEWLMDRASI